MTNGMISVGGVAQSRFTQCDHCGEVDNRCEMKTWESLTGEEHSVHHAEVDDYLAELRSQFEPRRLTDGTLVV